VIYTGGKGISLEVKRFPVIIQDQSKSSLSREFINKIRPPYFKILAFVDSDKEIVEWLDKGKASLVLVIPPDFERKVKKNNAKIQIIIDGTMSMTATIAISYLSNIAYGYSLEIVEDKFYKRPYKLPQIEDKVRLLFNPNNLSSWFMSLLELFNMITMVSLLLSSAALIREKEYGTIEQLLITPVKSWEVFLAKILPTVLTISTLSLFSLFFMVKGIFKVPVKGNIFLFYIVTCFYIFTMSSLGITIATFVNNLSQAMMVILVILVPMLMISGAWSPPEAMHPVIKCISFLSPMRYFLDFGYGVLLKGNGLYYVWKDIIGILLIGFSLLIISVFRFHQTFAK